MDHSPRPDLSQPFAPEYDGGEPEQKRQKRRKRAIEGELRSYKIRMIPNAEQKRELKRCFSAARHAYNHTVAAINEGGARVNFFERRNAYIANWCQPEWAEAVANQFVSGGVEAAVNAFKTNFEMRRRNPSHTFDVHHISYRKTKTEVIRVENDAIRGSKRSTLLRFAPVEREQTSDLRVECLAFFGSNLKDKGGIRMQDKRHVIDRLLPEGKRLKETCRIQWDKRTDAFYFVYVYDLPAVADPDPEFETKRLVATDPGVRTFQTWFSPTSGEHGKLFDGGKAKMEANCAKIDSLVSRVTRMANSLRHGEIPPNRTFNQRKRTFRALKRKLAKERRRQKGWMASGHYSCANYLLENFDVVVAPQLPTAALARRDGRVFGSQTARSMFTWSHGLFCKRLHSAAFRWPGRHVLTETGEPGTSKTCAHCGHWHAQLGASSVFHCPACGVRMDRDVAGARNNFFAAYGQAVGIGWDSIQH